MAKTQTQTTLEPLDNDPRIVAANAILNTLKSGLGKIKAEIDSLAIEGHLGSQPSVDRRAEKKWRGGLTSSRNDLLRERLTRNRTIAPEKKADEPVSGDLPAAVVVALGVCNATRSAPPLLDQRALIEQRKRDAIAVSAGIAAQERVRDTIREEVKYARTLKDVDPWFALLVRRYRAMQSLAAIDDEIWDFQKQRLDGGYGWRVDLLPESGERVARTLGSERDHLSEVSKMRRDLEGFEKI